MPAFFTASIFISTEPAGGAIYLLSRVTDLASVAEPGSKTCVLMDKLMTRLLIGDVVSNRRLRSPHRGGRAPDLQ
jgi:hypothetical protein